MKYFKFASSSFVFASLLIAPAANADIYDVMIAPLIAKCPTFISGSAQIRINATGFSSWEGGRHAMGAQCYETTPLTETVVATQDLKHAASNNPTQDSAPVDGECEGDGSIIAVDSRALGEIVPIVGTSFSLAYFTKNTANVAALNTVRIPTFDSNPNVTAFEIAGTYADGRVLSVTTGNVAGHKEIFTWDGKDSLGNFMRGPTKLNFQLKMTAHGKVIPITFSVPLGGYKAEMAGFGSWQPTILHYYDTSSGRLYKGDGSSSLVTSTVLSGGNLRVVDPDSSGIYIFSNTGKHLYTKTMLTGSNRYVFNYTSDLLTSIDEPYGKTTTFTRVDGLVTTITSPHGQVTELIYDGNDRLSSIVAPDLSTSNMTYNASGLLATFQKPGGQVSSFTYDSSGLLLRDSHSSGFFSNLVSSIDPNGHNDKITTLTSPMKRKTEIRTFNSLGTTKEYSRNVLQPTGEQFYERNSPYYSSITYPTYRSSSELRLDPRFNGGDVRYPSRETLAIGKKSHEVLTRKTADLGDPNDPFSFTEIVTQTNIKGKLNTSTYIKLTNEFINQSAENRESRVKLNEFEKVVQIQEGSLLPINFVFNDSGYLSQSAQGERVSKFTYDANGNVETETSPLGTVTRYTRDSLGRVIAKMYHDGRIEKYSYDANSNITSITPPSRPAHTFLHNAFEYLQKYLPPSLGGINDTTYSYNLDKQLTEVGLPDGRKIRYNYGYDHSRLDSIYTPDGIYYFSYYAPIFDRPSLLISPDGIRTEYSFYGPFVSSERQIPAGTSDVLSVLSYKYDDEFRLSQLIFADKNDNRRSTLLSYDKDNLLSQIGDLSITRGDRGQINSLRLGTLKIDVDFADDYGDLSSITLVKGVQRIFGAEYSHDKAGRISAEQEDGKPKSVIYYDSTGRLIGRKAAGAVNWLSNYTYDANGNRIAGFEGPRKFTATYDVQDRLLTWNNNSYAYTANGDLLTKTVGSKIWTYKYDVFGNLKSASIVEPNSSTRKITYEIDGKNRRVSRRVGNVKVRYVYDGNLKLIAQLSEQGVLEKYFVYGTGNSPDVMKMGGNDYLFLKDIRGSIRMVVDSKSGEVVQSLTYTDWGEVVQDTNPGFQPFAFAGGLYDSDTRLLRFGARDYDPEVGRWTSKDPLLFGGGAVNLYSYVDSDPINSIDPTGKFRWLRPIIRFLDRPSQWCMKNPDSCASIPDTVNPPKLDECDPFGWGGDTSSCKENNKRMTCKLNPNDRICKEPQKPEEPSCNPTVACCPKTDRIKSIVSSGAQEN